ncbi:MAG TPA: isocitrate lyase/phosphoenolpyruvate mutase family protein [Thermoanaerobaculia bacterium]|nr:isocitrate lyase/phosphoenolpyruvate mutase family protein [Thermoanaerobaculia bacterium]
MHESGCFVLPNPWDVGSARYLRGLGFKALASTSSGAAWSLGAPDNGITLEQAIAHVAALVAATDLPVNADFEHGFADDPEGVARHVARCLETGVAALSIEDSTGEQARPLYELSRAVERIQAARAAIDEAGQGAGHRAGHAAGDALLVGRAECFLTGHPEPLAESIRRLGAYAAAGADVLYAPGLRTRDQIAAVVAAVAPKPVNVLALPGMRVAELAELGVRRISVGGGLARAAWGGFLRAAREIAETGTFTALGEAPPGRDLDAFFTADLARHPAD